MRGILFIISCCALAQAFGVFVPPRQIHKKQVQLLGEKKCTYGPSYWCENLFNAGDCHATKHCIQTVWSRKQLPPDTSNICDTCKQMVEQAREQLLSNETQEEIKEVFEGTCALIHIKPVVEICDKIADDYALELIDTLASEMNPQMVCSTAGLCNNPKLQQLIADAGEEVSTKPTQTDRNRCDDCNTVMDIVVKKFNGLSKNEFMNELLQACGQLSSFSDSCSNIVVRYISDIYSFIKEKLNANDFCLLSGECYTNFHKHAVEITPMSKIGFVQPQKKDDLPCEFCEQLVKHLEDILIANTTETEFKEVLEGLCKQTRSFSEQCLSVVDEYYPVIYNYLVNGLNATKTCTFIGVCPSSQKIQQPIAPLLFEDTAKIALNIKNEEIKTPQKPLVVKVIKPKGELTIGTPEQMQLPIDLLTPRRNVYNEQLCMFCQYFLHYCQEAITNPSAEAEIKKVIDEACLKLPKSVNSTCIDFVNTYEPALVAILAQEIDPSQVCPMIRACPSEKAKDVEVFMNAKSSDKCPFCLAIMTEIESLVKDKTSKADIKHTLETVCNRLPRSLKTECVDFIDTYTDELVEMIIAEFKPVEVCEYLKFCKDTTPVAPALPSSENEIIGDTETNAILDDTFNGKPVVHNVGGEECVLCEFIMKEIDDELKNKKTDAEIKSVVHSICKVLPQSVRTQCDNFVDQYADIVILLLQESLEPNQICAMMKLCPKPNNLDLVREEVSKCGVCISAVDVMTSILENPKIERNFNHVYEKTCRAMPLAKKQTEWSNLTSLTFCNYNLKDQDRCSTDPQVYFNQMKQLIKNNICTVLIVANYSSESKEINKLEDPIECLLCKAVVNEAKKEVKGQKIKDKIKDALEHVCKRLHKFKKCSEFVDKYSDKLVDFIMDSESAEQACSQLALCEYTDDYQIEYELSDYFDETIHYREENAVLTHLQDPVECLLCKAVVNEVKKQIKGQKTKDKIKDALENVCQLLHTFKKCNDFVDKYSDKLVDFIMEYESAQQVCSQLTLCEDIDDYKIDYPSLEYFSEYIAYSNDYVPSSDENPLECLLCKAVIKELDKELKGPKTKEKIKKALSKICNHLHKFKKCSHFVEKYSDKLIDLILQYGTSTVVCSKLMFCMYEDLSYIPNVLPSNDYLDDTAIKGIESLEDPLECLLCKAVVNEVEKEVKGQKTKDKIKNALEHVCKRLHKFKKCSKLVDKYSDKLVDLIMEYENAGQVCSQLTLCELKEYDHDIVYKLNNYLNDINNEQDMEQFQGNQIAWSSCIVCDIILYGNNQTIIINSRNKEEVDEGLLNHCEAIVSEHCRG